MLPAASETEKVTTVSPTSNSSGASLAIFAVKSPSLLSVAVAAAKKSTITSSSKATTLLGISTLILIESGTVSSGSTTSRLTLTIVCAVPVLPAASVAEKVTVVSPNRNKSVGASLEMDVIAPSTLSVAETPAIIATISGFSADKPSSVPSTTNVPGAVISGAVVSATVAVAVALDVFPAASVTVNVTTVAPSGRVSGASLIIVKLLSTLSVATALSIQATTAASVAAVPLASVAAIVPSAGAVITGAV